MSETSQARWTDSTKISCGPELTFANFISTLSQKNKEREHSPEEPRTWMTVSRDQPRGEFVDKEMGACLQHAFMVLEEPLGEREGILCVFRYCS